MISDFFRKILLKTRTNPIIEFLILFAMHGLLPGRSFNVFCYAGELLEHDRSDLCDRHNINLSCEEVQHGLRNEEDLRIHIAHTLQREGVLVDDLDLQREELDI